MSRDTATATSRQLRPLPIGAVRLRIPAFASRQFENPASILSVDGGLSPHWPTT